MGSPTGNNNDKKPGVKSSAQANMVVTRDFCQRLPKVELHAHVNGSVSVLTLSSLLVHYEETYGQSKKLEEVVAHCTIEDGDARTLNECFELFGTIHTLVCDTHAVALVTASIIREFAEDGVCYLELRTTPRAVPENGMSKEGYVEAILGAMELAAKENAITVRLLLSIDRRGTLSDAQEAVALAVKYEHRGVVGIDLSGNPNVGSADDFGKQMQEARQHGLRLAVHFGEVDNPSDSNYIVHTLRPDRLGHGTFIPDDVMAYLTDNPIPLEVCLTSNVMCRTVSSYDTHHFLDLYRAGYPCAICTDDKGVFNTTLSKEYYIAATNLHLTPFELWELSYRSIDYIFANNEVKEALHSHWKATKQEMLGTVTTN